MCLKTFTWKSPHNKTFREQRWFELWIREAYSIRQLSQLSGHSPAKLTRIKNYWLSRFPQQDIDYSAHPYIIYDATYFHQDGCFICLMDAVTQKIIAHTYAPKEGFKSTFPWLEKLKANGLNPLYVIMDGELSVMRAVRLTWPKTAIQRCLYHIQREGMRWLRTYPKTQAGSELRAILSRLSAVKSFEDRDFFFELYYRWLTTHQKSVHALPNESVATKDLKRTMTLLKNALPDMFHYLKDPNVHHTTNALEGFYSRLKSDYQRHRGLSKHHRLSYLRWYCYLQNSNTF